MTTTQILTPCLPKKHCPICEARLTEVFGSADHTNKYLHQASEAGLNARKWLIQDTERAIAFVVRAAGFANLALNKTDEAAA